MAEAFNRVKHKAKLQEARAELRELRKDTPHRRDLVRYIHRLEKEIRIYDFKIAHEG